MVTSQMGNMISLHPAGKASGRSLTPLVVSPLLVTGVDFSLNCKLEEICHGIMCLKRVGLERGEGGGGTPGKRIPNFQPPQ